MTHVQPLTLEEFEQLVDHSAGARPPGIVRNSERTMARRPEILRAFSALARTVFTTGTVAAELKNLVALVASEAAGCRYCQAHRVSAALGQGTSADRIAAAWSFETSDLFGEDERAALRYAQAAGVVPNAVTPEHVASLRRFFDDGEIVELTGVIATMGFLNRWNDSLATELEDEPASIAEELVAPLGWEAGKHGSAGDTVYRGPPAHGEGGADRV